MQGYFNFKFYGNEKEIKEIAKKMYELGKTNDIIDFLNQWFNPGEYERDLTMYLSQFYTNPSWFDEYNDEANRLIEKGIDTTEYEKYKDIYSCKDNKYYEDEDEEDEIENEYELSYGMEGMGTGNINFKPFPSEDIMSELCKEFKDYLIEAEDYWLDYPPYKTWRSERGCDDYTVDFQEKDC